MSCCTEQKQRFIQNYGWTPNKYDYQQSNPSVATCRCHAHPSSHVTNARGGAWNRSPNYSHNPQNYYVHDRTAEYYGRREPLFGRINAGGYDQPNPWNEDGDQ